MTVQTIRLHIYIRMDEFQESLICYISVCVGIFSNIKKIEVRDMWSYRNFLKVTGVEPLR